MADCLSLRPFAVAEERPGREGGRAAAASEVVELIDPFVAADAFAGRTVTDPEMGRAMMKARGKKVPRVGQMAPEFELRTPDGKQSIRLSSFRGKQPVVLIFGSHT